ncbi:MAG: hypothetical protein JHC26_13085, partial [Thermofilum sp.]|uniref:hypothetical protein n=1 Tax=Thermofilum sp. TaxID=1961369 RepID=UPI002587427E
PGPTVLPNATVSLPSSKILTSNDGSLSTNFKFSQPIPLVADTEYCIVIRPESSDPGFEVWVAELGGVDVKTGSRITRSPFSGSVFTSQNNRVWSPRQSLDLTMNINMASFSLSPGRFSLINNDDEFIVMKDYVGKFKVGEIVEQNLGNGVVASAIVEKVIGNKIWLNKSNGLFIKSDTIDVIGKESSAAMRIEDFFTTIVDVIHPQISYLEFDSTLVGFELTYYTIQSSKTTIKIEPNVDTTLLNPAVLRSKSVEVSQFSGYKSLRLSIDMSTQTENISPMFDLSKCGLILISNRIGNTPLELEKFDGNALSKNSKYITKLVTLADGMDAEDLQVYLTANIPGNTFVDVFYKIINSDDVRDVTENYSLHEWNKMVQTSIPGNNSSGFIEYKYVPEESAYTSDGFIKYTYDGDTFVTYKFYMIKVVMRSDSSSLLPIIKNFRSIALQK